MIKKQFWKQVGIFVIILLLIIAIREYSSHQLIAHGIVSYQLHMLVGIGANVILSVVSFLFIKKHGLLSIAGMQGTKLTKWSLLLFPLYLVLLNISTMDALPQHIGSLNITILIVYSISIGVAEELSIRGFLQSYFIRRFGTTKKAIVQSIFAAALFFGLIHLLNFDKGIYGELSQVCFALFIGLMFGALLVITKRIYPLIILHSIIDFFGKLDATGLPVQEKAGTPMVLENAVFISVLALPCLVYALILLKRNALTHQAE
jgi:membrane protease YdiL (CAAX protease family)